MALKFFNLIKSNYGSILDKIQWKNKDWGAVMPDINPHDFWGKIGQYFPGGIYSIGHNPLNPLEQTWRTTNPDILFKFYPGSNTTSAAGLSNCYTLDITISSNTFKIRFCQ